MRSKEFYRNKVWAEVPSRFYTSLLSLKQKNLKVLDVGCGAGEGTRFIKKLLDPSELVGVDISKEAVRRLRKKGIRSLCLDVGTATLPFNDNYFDIIVAFEVIEHVFDTGAFITELRRVLRTGGHLFISTPNLAWWANRLLLLFGYQLANTEVDLEHSMLGKPKLIPGGTPAGHIHVFTYRAMREFLIQHKWRLERVINVRYEQRQGASFSKRVLFRIFHYLDTLFSVRGSAAFHIFIAEKPT